MKCFLPFGSNTYFSKISECDAAVAKKDSTPRRRFAAESIAAAVTHSARATAAVPVKARVLSCECSGLHTLRTWRLSRVDTSRDSSVRSAQFKQSLVGCVVAPRSTELPTSATQRTLHANGRRVNEAVDDHRQNDGRRWTFWKTETTQSCKLKVKSRMLGRKFGTLQDFS